MTKFNGTTVIERGNRPSPIVPTKLDFYLVKAGSQVDPYQVCSVHIFPNTQFGSADPYINLNPGATTENYGLVSATNQNFLFHNYKRNESGNRVGFDAFVSACPAPTSYTGDLRYAASSIFKVDNGHFSVILQPSGFYYAASAAANGWTEGWNSTASSVGAYLDIWTVVDVAGSKAQIYVNTFGLQTANTFATTEPLQVTTNNKLIQRYVEVGSKKRLRVKTELVVDNEPIKQSLRNLMETGSLLQNPKMRIVKLNESPELTSRVMIQDFDDTAANVDLDPEGTISYMWDTASIVPKYSDDILGGARGVYEITVKYDLIEETILSPKFKLIVR